MWMLFIPFVVLVLFYFLLFNIYRHKPVEGTVMSAIFKCLPIIYLLGLVRYSPRVAGLHDDYRFYISLGLLLSLGGDWMLNWMTTKPSFFLPGVGCFAMAQISYTLAFGFDPFGGQTLFMFTLAGLCVLYVLLPGVKPTELRPFVTLYMILLGVMAWRATARYKQSGSLDTWLAMTGAISFVVSDFAIGFNQWKGRIPRALFVIMVTYYIAQMLITYSVLLPTWHAMRKFTMSGV